MDQLVSAIRWLHIAAGFTAFFVAPVAMIVRKGGKQHRLWGKIYFWAMTVATVAALSVAAYRPNYFLLGLSVFSFHLTFVGYRALFRKQPNRGDKAQAIDWLVTSISFLAGVGMCGIGLLIFNGGTQILFLFFGLFMIVNAVQILKQYIKPSPDSKEWFISHMNGMLASYIAAVTAFSAVNFSFLPMLVRWLWPSAIGAPLIAIWVSKYRKKFASGMTTKQVAEVKIGETIE